MVVVSRHGGEAAIVAGGGRQKGGRSRRSGSEAEAGGTAAGRRYPPRYSQNRHGRRMAGRQASVKTQQVFLWWRRAALQKRTRSQAQVSGGQVCGRCRVGWYGKRRVYTQQHNCAGRQARQAGAAGAQ